MAEWKPFDLKWGRNIWYCSACEESTEVPTYLGTPMYNFCPMCGANMNMKSENKEADTPQTDCRTCKWAEVSWTSHYCDDCKAHNKYEPNDTPQTEEQRKVQEAEHRMANIIADMTPQTESTRREPNERVDC